MSKFTNPYFGAVEDAEDYIRGVLELLGDREPLVVLDQLYPEVVRLIGDLSDEQVRTPEKPGKWSMNMVLQHLVDSEIVWAWRLRLILAQERPTLTGYDQDAWAAQLRYSESNPTMALEELRILRASNLRLLKSLRPDQLVRVGIHTERGEERVDHMMRMYAGHDLLHRNQLIRIRTAIGI